MGAATAWQMNTPGNVPAIARAKHRAERRVRGEINITPAMSQTPQAPINHTPKARAYAKVGGTTVHYHGALTCCRTGCGRYTALTDFDRFRTPSGAPRLTAKPFMDEHFEEGLVADTPASSLYAVTTRIRSLRSVSTTANNRPVSVSP